MMEARAVRLDLPDDFIKAWGILEEMGVDDYAAIEVGRASKGVVGSDLKVLEEQSKMKQAQGTTYAARSKFVSKLIPREEFDMAQRHRAKVVDPLPPGLLA